MSAINIHPPKENYNNLQDSQFDIENPYEIL